ncbi:uncharacterized protein LOC117193114 [Drosophila miranda]|uniref:uncharacterized protein LOC117193114 n=1 Tax=Drosophila miranda TaxID=7229 RepID=UPI00143F87CA|nr:uncharacterized protein LOC117193114 [Drosophila miranda]
MGWFQGNVKIIACEDERSVKLYKAAVAQVGEVYAGAKLVAVDWSEVPSRPRARIWVPATFKEPERILKMLQRCNPGLPTSDWKVAKVETTQGPTNQAVLVLNKESLAPIEAAKGELNFGFSSVTIKVYKSDAAAAALPVVNPDVQDVTAEIEARWWRILKMVLRILQINLHHCKAASAALILRLDASGADVVLIQEPWVVGGKVCGLLNTRSLYPKMKRWR